MRRGAWSPEADAFLQENLGKRSQAEIGTALGKTKKAVQARCVRLELRVRPLCSPAEVARWEAQRVAGVPIKAIARAENRRVLGKFQSLYLECWFEPDEVWCELPREAA